MKILFYIVVLMFLCPPSVLGQACSDYACVIRKVKKAMTDKNYRLAFEQLESAYSYPDKEKHETEISGLRKQLFDAVEKEKDEAQKQRKRAEDAIIEVQKQVKIAESATTLAKQNAIEAQNQTEIAQKATIFAKKQVRAANNTATFVQVEYKDPMMAMFMMQYNKIRHPENEIFRLMLNKKIEDRGTVVNDVILREHSSDVLAVAFSPDGKKVLTGSKDGMAKLWDVDSGKVEKSFIGHSSSVKAVAFSPDGKKILTGSEDGTAKLWDIDSGKTEKSFIGNSSWINAVAFSFDGRNILTGSEDGIAKIWDIASGKAEKLFIGHFKKKYGYGYGYSAVPVNAITFSLDGKMVLEGWRQDGFESASIYAVAFSPDGKKILTGSEDRSAKIWDIASGKVEKSFVGDSSVVCAVAFSLDGKKVLTGSGHGTVKLWDITSEKAEKSYIGHLYAVSSVAFSPDGKKILTGSSDAKLWDVISGKAEKSFIGHLSSINAVAFSPDGKKVLTGSNDGTAKLWRLNLDEDWNFPFTMYDLVQAGLQIESVDSTSYKQDSTDFTNKMKRDSLNYLMDKEGWENSADYKQHLQKRKDYVSPAYLNDTIIYLSQGIIAYLEAKIEKTEDMVEKRAFYKIIVDTLTQRLTVKPNDEGIKEQLLTNYTLYSLTSLITKQYKQAQIIAEKGLALNKNNAPLKFALADALLVQGKYTAAELLYFTSDIRIDTINNLLKGFQRENWKPEIVQYPNVIDHINFLKEEGIAHPDFEKIIIKATAKGIKANIGNKGQDQLYTTTVKEYVGLEDYFSDSESKSKQQISYLIESLQTLIRSEPDTLKRYQNYGVLIDTIKELNPKYYKDYIVTLADAYKNKIELAFLLYKFNESEQNIRAGLEVNPQSRYFNSKLAIALLLQGKFKDAKTEYEKMKNEEIEKGTSITYRKAFIIDLENFEKNAIIPKDRAADVAKIRALLEKKE
jgi:WD40 repeat protein